MVFHRSNRSSYAFLLALLAGFLLLPPSVLLAQDLWNPYFEIEGRTSSRQSLQRGNVFVPLFQNDRLVIFSDLRETSNNYGATEGNFGLAGRYFLNENAIIGAYAFYDLRKSRHDNVFHQASVGTELLSDNWGLRINGYFPGQGSQVASALNRAFIENGNLLVQQGREAAYRGFDFEGEAMLWQFAPDSIFSLGNSPAELWASAGMYHFEHGETGFENMTGPRARTELRLFDLPMLGDQSRVVLLGQYEHDNVRGSNVTAALNVRFTFGGRRSPSLYGMNRRMVAPIVRNNEIVVHNGGPTERAKVVETGRTIASAQVVDANDDITTIINGAGDDSLIVVDGSAGLISLSGTILPNNGQTIMGGGSQLLVMGLDSGATATFTGPGSRPTLDANSFNAFNLTMDDSIIQALNITNANTGIRGTAAASNHLFSDLLITDSTKGVDFAGSSSRFTDVTVARSSITSVTIDGDQNVVNRLTISEAGSNGLAVNGSNNTFNDTSISYSDDVFATALIVGSSTDDSGQFNTFNRLTIDGRSGDVDGIRVGSSGDNSGESNTFADVTIMLDSASSDGISVGSSGVLSGRLNSFSNVTITGGRGISVGSSGNGSGSLNTFSDISITGRATDPFTRLLSIGSSGPASGSQNTFTNLTLSTGNIGIAVGSSGINSGGANTFTNTTISNLVGTNAEGIRFQGNNLSAANSNTFTDTTIRDTFVDGATAVTATSGVGSAQANTITNLSVTNFSGVGSNGIRLEGVSDFTLNNSSFTSLSGDVLEFTNATNLSGTGNTATGVFGNFFNDGGGNTGSIQFEVNGVPSTAP